MKHNYLFIIAFLIISFSQAQIVNIPDANFKDYVLFLGDLNNDGELQVSEAELFTDLNLMYVSISSLEGINSFINLETLNCTGSNLTSLDVSNLTSLKVLHCSNNQLTSLEVNNALSLEELNFSHNQLTNVNLNNLVNLKILFCHVNQLVDLDVSNLSELETLLCFNNQLVDLDLADLTNLVGVSCENNEITSLNLESSTNLKNLTCGNNSISSLNINGLTNLETLDYSYNEINILNFTTLTGLKTLACSANEIVNLDLRSLTNLEFLYCNANNLEYLDIRNGFNDSVEDFIAINNSELTCIYVDDKNAGFLSSWQIDSTTSFVNNEEECTLLFNEEFKMDIFSIYPNPVSDELTIESKNALETISIFDVNGRQLQTIAIKGNTNTTKIDISRLSKGVYFISIKTEVGVQTSKIIKE